MKRATKVISIILIALFLSSTMVFASGESESQKQGVKVQEDVMMRAIAAVPVPEVHNFLTRKTVAKWIETMDQPGKIFYIYILSMTGDFIGYFVAEYRPVSVATFLTPTERAHWGSSSGFPMSTNSLDGTYYGSGSGASNQYFFFDAESGAYIELKGLTYIVSDQPFSINAPRLKIK